MIHATDLCGFGLAIVGLCAALFALWCVGYFMGHRAGDGTCGFPEVRSEDTGDD